MLNLWICVWKPWVIPSVSWTSRTLDSIRTCVLVTSGRIYAGHFCYLIANVPFGSYRKNSDKLAVLGSIHAGYVTDKYSLGQNTPCILSDTRALPLLRYLISSWPKSMNTLWKRVWQHSLWVIDEKKRDRRESEYRHRSSHWKSIIPRN